MKNNQTARNSQHNQNFLRDSIIETKRKSTALNVHKVRIACASMYLLGIAINFDTFSRPGHLITALAIGSIYMGIFLLKIILQNRSVARNKRGLENSDATLSRDERKTNAYSGTKKRAPILDYLAISIDYIAFFAIIATRSFFEVSSVDDIFLYILKNPILIVLFILLVLPLMYLRASLLIYSCFFFIFLLSLSIVGLNTFSPQSLTIVWKEHALGEKVNLTLLLVYSFVAIALVAIGYYTIQLFYSLVNVIASAEAQTNRLKQYFSPKIANQLVGKEFEELNRGRRLPLAILFIDIKGFTNLSEKLSAEDLLEFLSRFRDTAAQVIFDHSGSIDKFVGDAIIAVFGAPIGNMKTNTQTACRQAVQTGLEIQRQLETHRETETHLPVCELRMGIHVGETFIGNVKSRSQMEYTVLGSSVNIANRLQLLCKKYNARCIVSDEVYRNAGPEILAINTLEKTLVRGIQEPMTIHVLA